MEVPKSSLFGNGMGGEGRNLSAREEGCIGLVVRNNPPGWVKGVGVVGVVGKFELGKEA
jgi:hypothetical protein